MNSQTKNLSIYLFSCLENLAKNRKIMKIIYAAKGIEYPMYIKRDSFYYNKLLQYYMRNENKIAAIVMQKESQQIRDKCFK